METFVTTPLYSVFDFVLVRAPVLPVERYESLNDAPISGQLDDPVVRCALALASPALLRSFERNGGGGTAAQRKLLRYLVRMCTRPTPFGLFAGVALGEWGDKTTLTLSELGPEGKAAVDMAWLLGAAIELERDPRVRKHLRLIANPAVFFAGGRVYLSERAPYGGGQQSPRVSLRDTNLVRTVLTHAHEPVPYAELIRLLLAAKPSGSTADAEALLDELVRQTLLLSELRPSLTTQDMLGYIVQVLARTSVPEQTLQTLREMDELYRAWNVASAEDRVVVHRNIVALAGAVSDAGSETPSRVDTVHRLSDRSISREVGEEAARAAEILLRLSPSVGAGALDGYRNQFLTRYGHHREVALLELLDADRGLGAPAGYSDSRTWSGPPLDPAKFARRNQLLVELACDALHDHARTVSLDIRMLSTLQISPLSAEQAPASLDIYVHVAARSKDELNAGRFKIAVGSNIGAGAAGKNLARFARALGEQATDALRRIADAERVHADGAVVAELVYFPRNLRSANVAIRPMLRDFEVALDVMPGVPSSRVIPLDELVVGVDDGRFYLKWIRPGRRVMLTSTHMLNYLNAPVLARFLADVGRGDQTQMQMFDWGSASNFPFLPRVEVGRIILRPAQWRIDGALFERESKPGSFETFSERLKVWREHWSVPRHVYLTAADNRLLLDLEAPAFADDLWRELRGLPPAQSATLQEVVPGLDEAWLDGPHGQYASEFVVSLLRRPIDARPVRADRDSARYDVRAEPIAPEAADARLLPPGGEWLFMKLYCSKEFEDDILAGPLPALLADVRSARVADRFFFLRYADPENHLRLRFHGSPKQLLGKLLPRLCNFGSELMSQGLCARFSFDTYDREIERYGGLAGTSIAEAIFDADSMAALTLLRAIRREPVDGARMALNVAGLHYFIRGFGLQETLFSAWRERYSESRHGAGAEFRTSKKALVMMLSGDEGPEQRSPFLMAAANLWLSVAPLSRKLHDLESSGRLARPLLEIYESLIHVHCNRLLGTDRESEHKIIGLLIRAYDSIRALRGR